LVVMELSTWMAIIYFSLNVVFLVFLTVYVKKTQTHKSMKSTSFLKAIWAQRKIFGPLLVYFYDVATDIGVVLYWYELAHDGNHYQSVQPMRFFWLGIWILAIYKVFMLLFTSTAAVLGKDQYSWYDPILVLFELYIFKTVYLSFKQAQSVIAANAEQKTAEAKTAEEVKEDEKATTEEAVDGKEEQAGSGDKPQAETAEQEVEPHHTMKLLHLIEAGVESFFQLIVQTAFILLSGDEPLLKNKAGALFLMILSILGSLVSISNKWISTVDEKCVVEQAASLKPKKQCPMCVSYWYLLRFVWRISDIGIRFVVWLLLGTVFSFSWALISFVIMYIVFVPMLRWRQIGSWKYIMYYTFGWVVWADLSTDFLAIALKHVSDMIALILIAIIGSQQVFRHRYFAFFIMGIMLLSTDILLYYAMKMNHILVKKKQTETEQQQSTDATETAV